MTFLSVKNRGFTLIELLVVISIIGLLSSIVLSSLNTARAKARDAQRLAALNQMRAALELFYSDFGYYPEVITVSNRKETRFVSTKNGASNDGTSSKACKTTINASNHKVADGLVPKYIGALPVEPGGVGCYLYASTGVDYKFSINTFESLNTSNHPFADTSTDFAGSTNNAGTVTPRDGTLSICSTNAVPDNSSGIKPGCWW